MVLVTESRNTIKKLMVISGSLHGDLPLKCPRTALTLTSFYFGRPLSFLPSVSDPFANAQLELACGVGSREAIEEALEEGADINFGGSTPLIGAILAGDRPTVEILVELGADVSCFALPASIGSDRSSVVDALMAAGPGTGEVPDEDPVDAKALRAFDRMIRNKGLAEPFKKKRGQEYATFRDGLKWVAAEDCHAVINEFLELLDQVAESDILDYLAAKAEQIAALSERYVAADDAPTELLKEYLKERKKLQG